MEYKLGRTWYREEYRINKKGCECFRTCDLDEAKQKLAELSAKRPGIYTMQRRSTKLDKYGCEEQPLAGKIWS